MKKNVVRNAKGNYLQKGKSTFDRAVRSPLDDDVCRFEFVLIGNDGWAYVSCNRRHLLFRIYFFVCYIPKDWAVETVCRHASVARRLVIRDVASLGKLLPGDGGDTES